MFGYCLFVQLGMIDPMTGEGIHHAMEGGKLAAEFLEEAFAVGNFDSQVMKEYQNRWMNRFGDDFKWYYCVITFIVTFLTTSFLLTTTHVTFYSCHH